MGLTEKKIITDYFRSNIFEAFTFYNGWKMLSHSKSKGVVSEEMANRYVEIQKYHGTFFTATERTMLISFVMLVLHPFDNRTDSYSLYKVNKEATETFVIENESVLDALQALRNKLFAHRDVNAGTKEFIIPSVENMDKFFENLIALYNKLTAVVDGSSTMFDNTDQIKQDIELLYMNLYRGEAMRKQEINIEWSWQENRKKASDIL